jgi:hypothetical protein
MSAREYRRWLIPKGNAFCPSGAAIASLVAKLRAEKWIVDPATDALGKLRFDSAPLAAKTGAFAKRAVPVATPRNPASGWEALPAALDADWIDDPRRVDLALRWPVHPSAGWDWKASAIRFPLAGIEPAAGEYDLELHRSDELSYPIAENIGPIDTECNCGEDLAFEWDDDEIHSPFGASSGIFLECSECSRTFDPSQGEAEVKDPFTGATSQVRGGATYRFALVLSAKEPLATRARGAVFHPDLVKLFEEEFGRDFYEVAALD